MRDTRLGQDEWERGATDGGPAPHGESPVRRWLSKAALVAAALALSSSPGRGQHQFKPSGGDDSAALLHAIRQYRHVQVAGPVLRIEHTVHLEGEDRMPLHGVIIEPAPGIPFVRVTTSVSRNEEAPTDPSRAVFNYNGRFDEGSFLTEAAAAGVNEVRLRRPTTITVDGQPGAPFVAGQPICLNQTSRVGHIDSTTALESADGALEVFRIVAVTDVSKAEVRVTLDRALARDHPVLSSALRCEPIERPTFRHLTFESISGAEPRAAIHMHLARHAEITGIRSDRWRGFSMILLDSGGQDNVIRDCFAGGVSEGSDWPNGWGIAVEGQEGTLILNSGASRFAEGIVINYSIDTWAYGVAVDSAGAVSLDLSPDLEGNPSIRSGFVGGRVWGGGIGAYIGTNCIDCRVDVDMLYPYMGVLVAQWTQRSVVRGRIFWPAVFAVGLSLLHGGPGDGAATSSDVVLDVLTSCQPARLALLRGPYVVPHLLSPNDGFYTLGPAMQSCGSPAPGLPGINQLF